MIEALLLPGLLILFAIAYNVWKRPVVLPPDIEPPIPTREVIEQHIRGTRKEVRDQKAQLKRWKIMLRWRKQNGG